MSDKRDLQETLREFENEWLALEPGSEKVVGHSADLRTAVKQAVEKGVLRPLLVWAPQHVGYCFF